jgi:hypothetical protein
VDGVGLVTAPAPLPASTAASFLAAALIHCAAVAAFGPASAGMAAVVAITDAAREPATAA